MNTWTEFYLQVHGRCMTFLWAFLCASFKSFNIVFFSRFERENEKQQQH